MKVKGVLTAIYDAIQVTAEFKRRQFILEITDDRGRTENISFELFQEHSKLVDSFKTGDKVVVDFNLKGRKWANPEGIEKYYNTLQAWKIVNDTEKENWNIIFKDISSRQNIED